MHQLSSKLKIAILSKSEYTEENGTVEGDWFYTKLGGPSRLCMPGTVRQIIIHTYDKDIIDEVVRWFKKMSDKNFRIVNSFDYKVDVGPFQGVFPIHIDDPEFDGIERGFGKIKIKFNVDYYDEETKVSWEDWFVLSDEELRDMGYEI